MGTREKIEALEKRYAMAFVNLREYSRALKRVRAEGTGILTGADRAALLEMRDVFDEELSVVVGDGTCRTRGLGSAWQGRLGLSIALCAFLRCRCGARESKHGEMVVGREEALMLAGMIREHDKLVRWVREHYPSEERDGRELEEKEEEAQNGDS